MNPMVRFAYAKYGCVPKVLKGSTVASAAIVAANKDDEKKTRTLSFGVLKHGYWCLGPLHVQVNLDDMPALM